MDILMTPISSDDVRFPALSHESVMTYPNPEDLPAVLDVLSTAQQPILLAGTGVKWSQGGTALANFAAATKMPIYLNGMGRGMLPADDPQFFNRTRRQAIKEGDVFVLAASPEYKLLARNRMGEHMKAAVAPSDGQLFVRTYKTIYCIGKRTR